MNAGATARPKGKRAGPRHGELWSLTRAVAGSWSTCCRAADVRRADRAEKGAGARHFVNRDMTQRLVAPPLDFGGTPSMCVVVSLGETDGHQCFKLHGAQERQARR